MKSQLPLTAVVLTKDEESGIIDCLNSLSWCHQVLVIDDYSQDRTVALARKFPNVQVVRHSLNNNFAAQRNFALSKVKTPWVLFIDADERVTSSLAQEIQNVFESSLNVVGYYLKRQDILWGRSLKHGETAHVRLLRLAQKNSGRWQSRVHETWQISGPTQELSSPLLHYSHSDLAEFLTQVNFYSTLRAQELFAQNRSAGLLAIATYPFAKFFYNYFLRLGFLDGSPGLALALIMSFHSFLVRSKLYLLSHRPK